MKPLVIVMKHFLREKRLALWLGFLLAALTALAGMALLSISGWFITATALAGLTTATAFAFDVFMPSAAIRFLALFRTAARYGERLVSHDATLSVLAGMRQTLFSAFATLHSSRRLAARPAGLLFRLTLDVDALDGLYLRMLVPAGVALVSALFAMLCLAFIDGLAGLSAGLFLILSGFTCACVAAMKARKPARMRVAALEALRARTIDLVAGGTDLLMVGRLEAKRRSVEEAEARLAQTDNRLNRLEMATGFCLGALAPLLGGALLLVLALLAERGVIGAPGAAFALLLALSAAEPFAGLRRGAMEAGRILAAARRIAPSLSPVLPEKQPPRPAEDLALRLENVNVRHAGALRAALSGLSLSIRRGETVALVGPSGAGKSTLLSLVAGELVADAGFIENVPCSLLTQRAELFADTLAGNLRLARPDASDGDLWHALEAAGLKETAEALPEKLESWLGEGGCGLSGGERRRLSLARVLLKDSPLLLLDEPTEALDAPTARDIVARLQAAKGARTMIIATHNIAEAAIADRILLFRDGKLCGDYNRMDPEFALVANGLRSR